MGKHSAGTRAEHVHGDGRCCFPGCPSYEIASRMLTELRAVTPYWNATALPLRPEMRQAVQKLLDDGVISYRSLPLCCRWLCCGWIPGK